MHKGMQQNLRKGRHSEKGAAYHVTFRVEKRRRILTDDQRRMVSKYLESVEFKNYWSLLAWVVMPDHVHVLFKLTGNKALGQLISRVKSKIALELNRGLPVKAPIWQKGFYDHGIRTDDALVVTARYIVANPIRSGLVTRIHDYPYWNAIWL